VAMSVFIPLPYSPNFTVRSLLYARRMELCLSLRDVAKLTELSHVTIEQLEKGVFPMTPLKAIMIGRALKLRDKDIEEAIRKDMELELKEVKG